MGCGFQHTSPAQKKPHCSTSAGRFPVKVTTYSAASGGGGGFSAFSGAAASPSGWGFSRVDDLVGLALVQDTVLVNAGAVGKGVLTHDGLGALHGKAAHAGHHAAGLHDFAGFEIVRLLSGGKAEGFRMGGESHGQTDIVVSAHTP